MDLPMQSGVSKAGNAWKKKEWVMETNTNSQYPRKVKFHVFGDRAETLKFEIGKTYRVSFDLESREFNGRWYTDVSVYAMTPVEAGAPAGGAFPQQPAAAAPAFDAPAAPFAAPANEQDDLPF